MWKGEQEEAEGGGELCHSLCLCDGQGSALEATRIWAGLQERDTWQCPQGHRSCFSPQFYGPRIGALYVRGPGTTTPLHPMLFGGGQERNFRPG